MPHTIARLAMDFVQNENLNPNLAIPPPSPPLAHTPHALCKPLFHNHGASMSAAISHRAVRSVCGVSSDPCSANTLVGWALDHAAMYARLCIVRPLTPRHRRMKARTSLATLSALCVSSPCNEHPRYPRVTARMPLATVSLAPRRALVINR